MSMAIIAERTATDVPLELFVNRNGGVTGLSPTVAVRDGDTDGSYLDFADNTFKAAGWTTRLLLLTEISAANAPGKYVHRLDVSAITNLPAATDNLIAEYEVTGGVKAVTQDIIQLTVSFLDVPSDVHDDVLSGHTTVGSAGRALLMALYQGKIWINTIDGTAGSVLGTNGTEESPVDNLADALTLATALGVRTFDLCGAITLAAAFENFTVLGSCAQPGNSSIEVAGQTVDNSLFDTCTINGVFGAGAVGAVFKDCIIGLVTAATNVAGLFFRCRFAGVIGLSSARVTQIIDGHNPILGVPTIFDFGLSGSGGLLIATNYQGSMTLRNMDHANDRAVGTVFGEKFELESSCTDGTVQMGGIARVVDNSTLSGLEIAGIVRGDELSEALDWLKNRRRIDFVAGPPRQLVLYERDGTTEKFRMDLTTVNGTEVLPFFAVQHERAVPV